MTELTETRLVLEAKDREIAALQEKLELAQQQLVAQRIMVPSTDWNTLQMVPTPVNVPVVNEVLDYLFNNRTWQRNPDALITRIWKWRQRLYDTSHITPKPGNLSPDDEARIARDRAEAENAVAEGTWTTTAVRLRGEGKSWNVIAAEVNQPRTTVRRVVEQLMSV